MGGGNKMYSVEVVARYIIMRCNKKGDAISNLKLQKILYFVQAEFLVAKGHPCFKEEFEAWYFGPVIPKIYHFYKVYGSATIPYVSAETNFPFSLEDRELIDGIIDQCVQYSALELVKMTHNQAPWKNAYRPHRSKKITNASIKKYFAEL